MSTYPYGSHFANEPTEPVTVPADVLNAQVWDFDRLHCGRCGDTFWVPDERPVRLPTLRQLVDLAAAHQCERGES